MSWTRQETAPAGVSSIFLLLVAAFALAGAVLAAGDAGGVAVFAFVFVGWVISLCLHEWGHAAVAYAGGDHAIAARGYLTLNPMLYADPMVSIVLPLAFLAMGGIGFPGGAVYVNTARLRGPLWRAAVSAAGPAMNLLFLIGIGLVLRFAAPIGPFAAALSLLGYLQATALLLNLLPIPGLDGFGILESVLPPSVSAAIRPISGFVMIAFFVAMFAAPALLRPLWDGARGLCQWVGIEPASVGAGFELFRFWLSGAGGLG